MSLKLFKILRVLNLELQFKECNFIYRPRQIRPNKRKKFTRQGRKSLSERVLEGPTRRIYLDTI